MRFSFQARRAYLRLTEEQHEMLAVRSSGRWRLCRYTLYASSLVWLALPTVVPYAVLQAVPPVELAIWRYLLVAAYLLGNLLAVAIFAQYLLPSLGILAGKRGTLASLEQFHLEQSRING